MLPSSLLQSLNQSRGFSAAPHFLPVRPDVGVDQARTWCRPEGPCAALAARHGRRGHVEGRSPRNQPNRVPDVHVRELRRRIGKTFAGLMDWVQVRFVWSLGERSRWCAHANEISDNEHSSTCAKDRSITTPGLRERPGGRGLSVLLTRLYAPSGDVAEPAYAARTSHWAASMKRGAGLRVAPSAWGLRGQRVKWTPNRSLRGRGSRAVTRTSPAVSASAPIPNTERPVPAPHRGVPEARNQSYRSRATGFAPNGNRPGRFGRPSRAQPPKGPSRSPARASVPDGSAINNTPVPIRRDRGPCGPGGWGGGRPALLGLDPPTPETAGGFTKRLR
jgi:hypothetical protein